MSISDSGNVNVNVEGLTQEEINSDEGFRLLDAIANNHDYDNPNNKTDISIGFKVANSLTGTNRNSDGEVEYSIFNLNSTHLERVSDTRSVWKDASPDMNFSLTPRGDSVLSVKRGASPKDWQRNNAKPFGGFSESVAIPKDVTGLCEIDKNGNDIGPKA